MANVFMLQWTQSQLNVNSFKRWSMPTSLDVLVSIEKDVSEDLTVSDRPLFSRLSVTISDRTLLAVFFVNS